jgi:NDP-sugar pyrophosphorylase family protein
VLSALDPKEIDVLILCGGLGKRLRSVINDRPKPMAEIAHRPFLDILIAYTSHYGFRRFILCLGYMKEVIKEYYQGKKGIIFSEERELLGTGGALKNAESLIRSDPFLVMNGDSFSPVGLDKFIDFHINKQALISIALDRAKKTTDYGVITLGGSQRIVSFNEKARVKKNSFVNAGIYLLKKSILPLIPPSTNYSLEYDLFPRMVGKGLYGYRTNKTLIDIGTPGGYKRAKEMLKDIEA